MFLKICLIGFLSTTFFLVISTFLQRREMKKEEEEEETGLCFDLAYFFTACALARLLLAAFEKL